MKNVGATMVIFDNDLSPPSQQRVLTELLGIQVVGRCGLILDIFAQRAKNQGGPLAGGAGPVPLSAAPADRYVEPSGTSGRHQRQAYRLQGPGETQLKRTAVLLTRRSTRSGQIWKKYVVSGPPSDSSGRRTRSRWGHRWLYQRGQIYLAEPAYRRCDPGQ